MSGARQNKRLLRTTTAAAVVGAVAFAPLAPLAQDADPVAIRVGANREFTRVEFAGVVGARARVRQDGREIVVRIGSTAAPDVSRLRVDPPPGVTAVETRAVRGATELVLTLAEGAQARSGSADGAVWLNLYAPGQAPPEADTPAVVAPVTAEVRGDQAVLTFKWSRPVAAAVFRRGEAVWIVFDQAARLDLTGATALGPARDARWAAGPDYTAVRISAPADVPVGAQARGGEWIVTLGGLQAPGAGVTLERDDAGAATLTARMAGATRVVWLTDPLVGDRFAAVTAQGPAKGLGERRAGVDLTLLPTAQGLGIETPADDLSISARGDLVTLTRRGGLILSPPQVERIADAGAALPRRAPYPALVLAEWSDPGHAGFVARHRELQEAAAKETIAAGDNPRAPTEARLGLARFLVGSGLGYEAIGVLNAMIAANPGLTGDPQVRGLRGAARASIGRFAEAEADFSAGALSGDPSTRAWRGYLAVQQGDWAEARRAFAAAAGVIDQFDPVWRARFGAAHAMAAVETGDLSAAKALLAYSFSQNAPPADQLTARLVQARLFHLEGQTDRALAVYRAVARAPLDGVATPARLGVIQLELASGAMKPDAAAAALEQLKWRWRGDATELAVIRALGELYLSQGRYREAMDALRGAGSRIARMKGAAELHADLANAFRALFLEGAADGLEPVQALALFYDFRELTPIGADGDEMVRRLARRLIDVDLLTQAAELLKHQVDNRLEGVAKAQVATELATVYLMNRQAEAALQALWNSRTTLLPTAMASERRALEARALMELGRYDHALEVLDRDQGAAAREVRADIAWKQEKWGEAAAQYEQRLGDRWRDAATPLTPLDESRLVRAGTGYSLAGDTAALSRLSRNYAPLVPGARASAALRVALDGSAGEARASDFAALSAGADTFAGWVAAMKAQIRERQAQQAPSPQGARQGEGGSRAATPASSRQTPAAAG